MKSIYYVVILLAIAGASSAADRYAKIVDGEIVNVEVHATTPTPRAAGVSYMLATEARAAGIKWKQPDLATVKAAKMRAIKAKTIDLVETGTFRYGARQFALDAQTRSNWVGAISAVNAGLMQYPRQVTAIDGRRVVIANEAAAKAFYGAGVAAVTAIEESAYPLIDAVLAATTVAELEAVRDGR